MTYYLRLDDACERRDIKKWDRMEKLLDKYEIKPLVGIIPSCQDPMMEKYDFDNEFWNKVEGWIKKGWICALHGFDHVFITDEGGINPVNRKSEFAGVPLDQQKEKIKTGIRIMNSHGLNPKVFFAPAHTFDDNTLKALKEESDIRIISDTISNKPYFEKEFTFVPQQSGRVRKLPFNTVTFCYHPNIIDESSLKELENFIVKHKHNFKPFGLIESRRKLSIIDKILRFIYFSRRK